MSMIKLGDFYHGLVDVHNYDNKAQLCIKNTVKSLLAVRTSIDHPGMLLGNIQSGKTRTFIGITGLAFDNQYDITIVLAKGTKALSEQTYQRLKKDFSLFIDRDMLQIFDIMNFPDNLIKYGLDQKIIIVAKKQTHNLERLHKALFETYPDLSRKPILIIDDEADFASIGFTKDKSELIKINKIASQIDQLREDLEYYDYLQVTATPYSLYLQPENMKVNDKRVFRPVKPKFTELVPVPDSYIGGDFYFHDSEDEDSVAYHIYNEISSDELLVLKKQDRRRFRIEDALISDKIQKMRTAIINFIVGGCIRRIQDKEASKIIKKYSFIVHTEQGKAAHEWQELIVTEIKDQLQKSLIANLVLLDDLIVTSYNSMRESIELLKGNIPKLDTVKNEVYNALQSQVMITKVNSEKDVKELLDEQGQLKLRTPLNIFIGGQILDRGITIGNLIGFYYGRNPKTFQQDTVLQHSRMYGYRPLEDLAVTRFYTTIEIYSVMKKIHEFDSALRLTFEKGGHDSGIIFIHKDVKNQIIPCSPNKILLSNVTTLKPHKRLLPVGFQTGYKTKIEKKIKELDQNICDLQQGKEVFLMDLDDAVSIINMIKDTFVWEEGTSWDEKAFISCLEYLSKNSEDSTLNGKVWGIVKTDRNIQRYKKDGRYEDSPDTPRSKTSEVTLAKNHAKTIPALILLRQNGKEEQGWKGSPFWWPVLITPENTETVVFASKKIE